MYPSLLSGLTRLSLWWRSLAALTLVAAVVACGGGGDGSLANVTGGGTGSFASGPITGFGSIIVNGVRYDDSQASVNAEDDDDKHGSNELKLGMMVTINGSAVSPGATATASSITFSSELKGSVTSKIGTDTLVVHGVNVLITATTVCDVGTTTGCASLKAGDFIEVHGFFAPATGSATAKLTATRIELEAAAPKFLKLRGAISNLNTASKTFNIGTQTATVTYATINPASVPASLTNGLVVRVKVDITPTVAGLWNAVRIKVPHERKVDDRDEAKIEGLITTAIDASKTFSVNGLKVDASNASLPAGGAAALVVGVRAEVEGKIVNGVLVASKVKLDDEKGNGEGKNELHGTISKLNTAASTFEVRGVTVDYSAASFPRGNAGNLVNNVSMVEVKGNLSADGTKIKAKTVKFEN